MRALLDVAALVRWSIDPDPDCITELHTLLTSGCDSPLYNADVPAAPLDEALHRARAVLDAYPPQSSAELPRKRTMSMSQSLTRVAALGAVWIASLPAGSALASWPRTGPGATRHSITLVADRRAVPPDRAASIRLWEASTMG